MDKIPISDINRDNYYDVRDVLSASTIKSFETDRIRAHGSIDIYDLMTELTDRFGCRISDRFDLIYKVQGTEIYYDKFLDRLYANADTYYRELDAAEGL